MSIKRKTIYGLMKEKRNVWVINPRTRVKVNEIKNKKKRRNSEKKMVDGYLSDQKSFFFGI